MMVHRWLWAGAAIGILGIACSALAQEPGTGQDRPMRRPVIFSYNHPWGSDRNPNSGWTDPWFMDFDKVRLSTANMVDSVDPKAYEPWRTPDHRILARTGIGGKDATAEELITAWDEALSAEGIDGMAVDEFCGRDCSAERIAVFIAAIKETRRRHPDKVLAFWTDSGLGRLRLFGEDHKEFLIALRDYADFIMPEIYYRESSQPNFATQENPFAEFTVKAEEWEKQAPGILPKILMGLGTVQTADWGYDNREDIDYGDFLAKQVEVCATHPTLKQMGGLALYAPGYLRPDTLTRVNEAIIEFYRLEPAPPHDPLPVEDE